MLNLINTDFKQDDFDYNITKIVETMRLNSRIIFYTYNDRYPNINKSLQTKLEITVEGYGIDITTTNNKLCSNPVYIYPNNTTDTYVLNVDSGVRYLGKVNYTK